MVDDVQGLREIAFGHARTRRMLRNEDEQPETALLVREENVA
jgi:hypothetical protein